MINDLEHLFICLLAICMCSWRSVLNIQFLDSRVQASAFRTTSVLLPKFQDSQKWGKSRANKCICTKMQLNTLWILTHLLIYLSGTNLTLLALTCFMRLGKQRAVLACHPDHVRFAASLLTDSQDRNETGRGSSFRGKTGQASVSAGRLSWVGTQTPLITTSLILVESLNLCKTQFPDL